MNENIILQLVFVLIALFSLLFLVVIHEYGHALAAQKLGITVKRFAIGFGKVLWSKTSSKSNIEYAICLLPLGGYVKFQDENVYHAAPIYKRFLIVIAGPLCNLIAAFLAYWLVFVIGITSLQPIIEKTLPHSLAQSYAIPAYSKIIAVDHYPVQTWSAIVMKLLPHLGNKNDHIELTVLAPHQSQPLHLSFNIDKWSLDPIKPDILGSLGIVPDKKAPQFTRQYSVFKAIPQSCREIELYLTLNGVVLLKVLTGKISLSSLAGPLSLFGGTLSAAHHGLVVFLGFIGFISLSLFFANLLPIPGLDGAYILYFLIEIIRGKPLSLRCQILLFQLGIIFICVIMFQTLMNDLIRLF
jgi:regulator of sigma E protease